MTKNEFLSQLASELNKRKIPDAADIISEYEQHFDFKMADGFSEEEISSKLGDPVYIVLQFASVADNKKYTGKKAVTVLGLSFADFFAGITFVLLIAWATVMVLSALAFAVIAVALVMKANIYSLIPPMPYFPAGVFGAAFAALAVLSAAGCVYFILFVRQLMHSYGRFHYNVLAAASDKAILPRLPIHPHLAPQNSRRIRTAALISAVVFAVLAITGFVVSVFYAGALEFWHVWGWFGFAGM